MSNVITLEKQDLQMDDDFTCPNEAYFMIKNERRFGLILKRLFRRFE